MYSYFEPRSTWSRGLVVSVSALNQRPRVDSQGQHLYFRLFFFFFPFKYFNAELLHRKDVSSKWSKGSTLTFYIELCMKFMGVGLDLALQKENKFGDPRFLFFFLKGNIIDHEIIIHSWDFQYQISFYIIYSKIKFQFSTNCQTISWSILS